MGKHDDFIKISYCIFKIHKPSINFPMKSSYEKALKSVNSKSSLYICILILYEPACSQEVLNWYMEIKVINLIACIFSNNVIL